MTRTWAIRLLAVCAAIGLTISVASADSGANHFSTRLSGFNEVAPILTNGSATVQVTIQGDSLTYTEVFRDGFSSPVTQSHIHFGERGVNGGIFLFLCTNLGNGPAGVPACPTAAGTVTRTVTAADFSGITAQNVPAASFDAAVRIIRSGDAYANVHTSSFPGGEIRGQLHFGDDD